MNPSRRSRVLLHHNQIRRLGYGRRYPLKEKKMSRMRKVAWLLIGLAVASLPLSPMLLYRYRVNQFHSAQQLVARHGCLLEFDLQGDYSFVLRDDAATDETLNAIVPTLLSLPNGFTFIGPGEGRHFYVRLENSNVTDTGLYMLCRLPISCLYIDNCPKLTDKSVDSLLTLGNPYAIISGSVDLSDEALRRLRVSFPNAFPSSGNAGG
jgi:hypothetical protein